MHRLSSLGPFLHSIGLTGVGTVVGTDPAAAAVRRSMADRWRGRVLDERRAAGVSPGGLDVAYLDLTDGAQHGPDGGRSVDAALAAVRRWWPAVRADGGVLAGAAYYDGAVAGVPSRVRAAVDAFAADPRLHGEADALWGLQVRVTLDPVPSWLLVKGAAAAAPRPGRRRVAVVTGHDAAQAAVAAVSSPNKAAYCRRHGYDFVDVTDGFDPGRPAAWSKLKFVRDRLAYYDWVFWSDADSLVMRSDVPLEAFLDERYDVILTHDDLGVGVHHVNTGQFFVRNTPWAGRFLDEAWGQTDFLHDRLWENRAVIHLLERRDESRKVQVVTQRRFNSYPQNYRPGDFLIHFPDLPNDRRVELMRRYAGQTPA